MAPAFCRAAAPRVPAWRTHILSRRFNREFINLGFSGNALLDYEIAELIAAREAALIILDFVSNATVQQMQEKMEKFYDIIRAKQPFTPILFIEDPPFPSAEYNRVLQREVEDKNKTVREIFERIKARGDAPIEFISSEPMIGADHEATVDGIHFTDLGFMRYADYLEPYIRKYIGD